MSSASLTTRLVDRLGARGLPYTGAFDVLERVLSERHAEAVAQHGDLGLQPGRWLDALVDHLSAEEDLLAQLRAIHACDLFLARACLDGLAVALSRFDALLVHEVRAAGRTVRATDDLVDGVTQHLRASLLAGERPALSRFAGRGDLRGFVRIGVVRELLRLMGRQKREAPADEVALAELGPRLDPELERFRTAYRDDFAVCFRQALAALAPRDRTVLRMNTFEKLSIDKIGALFDVHRATAARWLERIKADLAADTEERLAARLGVSDTEVESIIRLVRSEVHVSMERLLEDPAR